MPWYACTEFLGNMLKIAVKMAFWFQLRPSVILHWFETVAITHASSFWDLTLFVMDARSIILYSGSYWISDVQVSKPSHQQRDINFVTNAQPLPESTSFWAASRKEVCSMKCAFIVSLLECVGICCRICSENTIRNVCNNMFEAHMSPTMTTQVIGSHIQHLLESSLFAYHGIAIGYVFDKSVNSFHYFENDAW